MYMNVYLNTFCVKKVNFTNDYYVVYKYEVISFIQGMPRIKH